MATADFLTALQDGSAPREQRLIAARGLAPLPLEENIVLLISLTRDPEPDVTAQSALTLKTLPQDEVLSLVKAEDCDVRLLAYFAAAGASDAIIEAIILNPSTPGEVAAQLAGVCPAPLLETILYNRVRLLEYPEILQNAKLNPSATGEIRRLIQEIEIEFFGDKKREYTIDEVQAGNALPEAAEMVSLEGEAAPEDLSLEGLPMDPEEREGAISERLSRMTVPQKVIHALRGTREIRGILIRDPNREVAKAVLQSPRLSECEVEGFAAMRSVSEEVLREIGHSRAWTRSYNVILNLARNPKTPPSISQRLLFRLQSKDLVLLSKDRTVPDAVRQNAQRTVKQRSLSRSL